MKTLKQENFIYINELAYFSLLESISSLKIQLIQAEKEKNEREVRYKQIIQQIEENNKQIIKNQ
jgi:hypothetical protein